MTRFSYSKVSSYDICPRKYLYQYIEKPEKLPPGRDHAGLLGQTLGKMLEIGIEAGGDWYEDKFVPMTNLSRMWRFILEEAAEMLKPRIPEGGRFETRVEYDGVLGFVDWVSEDGRTVYDFKFSGAPHFYEHSPQVALYSYMLGATTRVQPKEAYYLCITRPKMDWDTEDWYDKRMGMIQEMRKSGVTVYKSKFTPKEAWSMFQSKRELLRGLNPKDITMFPKKKTGICRSCEYKDYCKGDSR